MSLRRELDARPRRLWNVRRLALLASMLIAASACSDSGMSSASTADTIPHPTGASDVVIQLGDYDFNGGPDVFVTGPELVVYGDGSVYTRFYDVVAGVAKFRVVKGRLSEPAVQDLLRRAAALPATTPVGDAVIDAGPLPLVVVGDRWEINDLSVNPFASFIEYLRATTRAAAVVAWSPTRWIIRPFGATTCSVAEQPSGDDPYQAPVYPHVVATYPLGTFTC
jgi:hypothetical protein